jgi:hypothetical protein
MGGYTMKVSKISRPQQKTSKWSSAPLKQEELVALKKEGLDGVILTLQGLPDVPVTFGNLDLQKSKWVTDGTKLFLSLADFGGKGVIPTENVVEVLGGQYRVDVGLKLSLTPLTAGRA